MGECGFCLQCFALGAVAALVVGAYAAALLFAALFKKGKVKGGKDDSGY